MAHLPFAWVWHVRPSTGDVVHLLPRVPAARPPSAPPRLRRVVPLLVFDVSSGSHPDQSPHALARRGGGGGGRGVRLACTSSSSSPSRGSNVVSCLAFAYRTGMPCECVCLGGSPIHTGRCRCLAMPLSRATTFPSLTTWLSHTALGIRGGGPDCLRDGVPRGHRAYHRSTTKGWTRTTTTATRSTTAVPPRDGTGEGGQWTAMA